MCYTDSQHVLHNLLGHFESICIFYTNLNFVVLHHCSLSYQQVCQVFWRDEKLQNNVAGPSCWIIMNQFFVLPFQNMVETL